MEHRRVGRASCSIGNAAHSCDSHSDCARDNHFGNGRHANGIRAEPVEHADFCPGFEGRTGEARVHSFFHDDADMRCSCSELIAKLDVVGSGHVGKSFVPFLHMSR